jgi:hypothetical protein
MKLQLTFLSAKKFDKDEELSVIDFDTGSGADR